GRTDPRAHPRLWLEDVRALPTPGGPDDFSRLVEGIVSGDPSQGSSRTVRTLFAIRHLIVHPPMIREMGRNWRARAGDSTPAHA
ncbi:MAG: DUF2867 domain-containing protein, partial [Thermoleophilaceae bacterium]|nr:DUF2867 domain-containing protein [Thermoleophilaceae bacterium]